MTEKEERRLIKGAFKYYKLRSGEIAEKITDCASGVCAKYKERGGKSSAMTWHGYDMRILDILSSEYYLWCKVVESTIVYFTRNYNDEYLNLIDLKYWQGYRTEALADKLHINRATVFKWEEQVIKKAREYAIFHHLIEP